MKRKNYIFSLASALLMGTMALSLTACSSEDNIANNTQQPAQGEARTYTVSIPATFSDNAGTRAVAFDNSGSTPAITTKFVEDEKVYVYNNTTSALLGGYLVVKNVSADMKSCELQGQLTGTINPDEEVVLYYNLNVINSPSDLSDVRYIYYNYDGQVGTAASCVDGAMATMKVKEIDASNNYKMTFYAVSDATKTQAKAEFDNLQSMFRFQFADATAPTTPIKVKTLNIQSKNVEFANRYYPLITTNPYYPVTGGINITPATATADYLYVGLCIRELSAPDDVLYFWVTDDEGNEYRGSKSAPSGGFANGKYYYNSAPIALTKQPAKAAPVITWTNPSVAVTPSESTYKYTFETAFPGSADITIANASGKDYCSGYAFDIKYNATIRLNAVNAIWNYQDSPFIKVSQVQDDATLVLTGDNTISCNGNDYAIDCTTLKLSCTGTSATLTVKTKTPQGMRGGTNYYSAPYDSENDFVVSNLAADGYTVERTGGTSPDADGVYTTTYTVTSLLHTPLTLEATANGSIEVYPVFAMKYSVDSGDPVEISAKTTINIEVTAGQKVSFYSTNSVLTKVEDGILSRTYIRPNIQCYVYGNVMSLIDDSGNGFANDKTISEDNALKGLFNSDMEGNVINHPTKRILLPATTLADGCYEQMFYGCTGLTVAPDLPATEMKSNCYMYMFYGCTNLTTAPDLLAPTLAEGCYDHMFSGCTNLNYVKCLATDVSAQYCLYKWLEGVSATGTFVKASGANWSEADANGSNGYPSGWTVTSE